MGIPILMKLNLHIESYDMSYHHNDNFYTGKLQSLQTQETQLYDYPGMMGPYIVTYH